MKFKSHCYNILRTASNCWRFMLHNCTVSFQESMLTIAPFTFFRAFFACNFKFELMRSIESHYWCPLRLPNFIIRLTQLFHLDLCHFFWHVLSFQVNWWETHTLFQVIAASNMNQIKVSSTGTNRFISTYTSRHERKSIVLRCCWFFVCRLVLLGLVTIAIQDAVRSATASITVTVAATIVQRARAPVRVYIKPFKFLGALFQLSCCPPISYWNSTNSRFVFRSKFKLHRAQNLPDTDIICMAWII